MAVKPKSARGTQILRDHLKQRKVSESVTLCVALLQTGQISGPYECAVATTRLLGAIISNFSEKLPVTKLLERVREVGTQLIEARPGELTIGNMLRRVLGLIKECSQDQTTEEPPKFDIAAYMTATSSQLSQTTTPNRKEESLFDILPTAPSSTVSGVPAEKLVRDIILDAVSGIDEILDELDSTPELTAAYSPSYIFPTDVILIQGHSPLAHRFLAQAAASSPGFVVFAIDDGSGKSLPDTVSLALSGKTTIEENEPAQNDEDDDEQDLAKPLAKLNVSVTIIPQAAVFAVMPQVTKVLISPDAVLPDGSIIAPSGSASIVLAAKTFRVPVLSLSGTYHFCPISSKNTSGDGSFVGNTGYAVGLEGGSGESDEDAHPTEPPDGAYYTNETVLSDGIELYVTNIGVCGKASIPKIMSEQYDAEFIDLSSTK